MTLSPGKAVEFLKEVVAEVKRVTWPTKESIIGGTAAVFAISAILTLYIWVLDLVFSRLLAFVLR